MNEWTSECVSQWASERGSKYWVREWMNEWMNERMKEWINVKYACINSCTHEWMDEQIETKNGWRLVKKWIEKPFEVVTNCFRFIASSFFNLFAIFNTTTCIVKTTTCSCFY